MKKLVVGALAAAAIVAAGSAPAQATSFPHDQPMPVDPGIGGSAEGLVFLEAKAGKGRVSTAMLVCPEGIGIAEGEEACAQLTMAEGDFAQLPVADGFCTKEYDPVTFRAFGFWDGEFVAFEQEYANYCVGVNETGGAVFDIGKP